MTEGYSNYNFFLLPYSEKRVLGFEKEEKKDSERSEKNTLELLLKLITKPQKLSF